MPSEVRTVELLGTTIRYLQLGRVGGDRPVLLLLHGIGDSSRTWTTVLDRLAAVPARRRPAVIAVDMLGHGGSSKPRTDYSLGAHANVLRDLLDHLGVTSVVVVGHSLGGGIAMQFLYQYPDRVEGLVLESPGGLGPDVFPLLRAATLPGSSPVIRLLSATLGMRVLEAVGGAAFKAVELARVPLPRDAGEVMRIVRPLVDVEARAAFVSTLRSVVDPAGQRVSALSKLLLAGDRPVTLVWGDRDPIIPVAHGHNASKLLPQARFEVFQGAGHFPHSDDPGRYADLLVDAVRTARAARRTQAGGNTDASGASGSSSGGSSPVPRSSRADTVTSTP
ncbi:alpha/beta fold hydrolase [Jatrophihabitans sp. YIM 134969]